jgi:CHAD domain-containing protein
MAKTRTPSLITTASPVIDALAALIQLRVNEIETLIDNACSGNPEAVHDMRVACRRLQAIVRIFKAYFHKKHIKKTKLALSGLISALGEVRECDVLIEHITANTAPVPQHSEAAQSLLLGRITARRCAALQNFTVLMHDAHSMEQLSYYALNTEQILASPKKQPQYLGDFLRRTIPALFDEFLTAGSVVVCHPLQKNALHKLRIQGKPIRYCMECAEFCFGSDFKACYREVKSVISLLGEIHDNDIALDVLKSWLREIRDFNRNALSSGRKTRIRTGFLSTAIITGSHLRKEQFGRLETIFNQWQSEQFATTLVAAMASMPYEHDARAFHRKEPQICQRLLPPLT